MSGQHGGRGGNDGDGGFAQDMRHFLRRRAVLAGLGAAGATGLVWSATPPAQALVSGQGADGTCVQPPASTAGPFPADGTNNANGAVSNILTESGVMRRDIRDSIGGLSGRAAGVTLKLEIRLVDVDAACAPLSGMAIYLWQCDASGAYSIYNIPDRNYLRGLQTSDAGGVVRFTTILPGCYPGRWPHFHFQVFASPETAVLGDAAILTSQFALAEDVLRLVYADIATYGASGAELDRLGLARDAIFRRSDAAELLAQTIAVTGDPLTGLAGVVTVGIRQ